MRWFVFRTIDQRKKLKRQAFLTSNVKKLFLEAISKLQLQSKGDEISKLTQKPKADEANGDEPIFNTCIYSLLLEAYDNLKTGIGSHFVEDMVPAYTQQKQNSNFPEADVMHAIVKVLVLLNAFGRHVIT